MYKILIIMKTDYGNGLHSQVVEFNSYPQYKAASVSLKEQMENVNSTIIEVVKLF